MQCGLPPPNPFPDLNPCPSHMHGTPLQLMIVYNCFVCTYKEFAIINSYVHTVVYKLWFTCFSFSNNLFLFLQLVKHNQPSTISQAQRNQHNQPSTTQSTRQPNPTQPNSTSQEIGHISNLFSPALVLQS